MQLADTRGSAILDAMEKGFATDPPVSEAQRKLMWATATGHGKSDVPASVAKKFAEADPGGKLPERAKDMENGDWRGLLRGLIKFFAEEQREPEHQEDAELEEGEDEVEHDPNTGQFTSAQHKVMKQRHWKAAEQHSKKVAQGSAPHTEAYNAHNQAAATHKAAETKPEHSELARERSRTANEATKKAWATHPPGPIVRDESEKAEQNAAGMMFLTADGQALFVKRASDGDHAGEWAFPGGNAQGCETPLECALREIKEETQHECPECQNATAVDHSWGDASQFMTFGHLVDDAFEPKLTEEHTEHQWRPIDKPPEPLHPGVKATLDKVRKAAPSSFDEPTKPSGELTEAIQEKSEAERRAADAMMAMDRAASARSYDDVGRLHVDQSNISKATVNPYFGKEIPDYEKLGLDPEKKYQLLRHPDELTKGARTFNNLPILIQHTPVSAEDYQPDLVVGATGSDAEFTSPYLTNSLVIWAKPAIDEVENGQMQQLSCAYSYTCDLTPGEYEGTHYDGIMRNLVGNHVAMVKEGRAGPDVMVGDSAEDLMMTTVALSPKAALAKGAIMVWLRKNLAKDAKVDLNPILEGVTARNFGKQRPIIEAALKIATRGRLAQDSDVEELPQLLEAIEAERGADVEEPTMEPNSGFPMAEPEDKNAKVLGFLKDKLPPDTWAQVDDMMRDDVEGDEGGAERMEREVYDRRAADARKRLGRDETEEERDEREKKESAEDARSRLGRDESEEERESREAGDKCARDVRRAKDALDAHRRSADGRKAADDRRSADEDLPHPEGPKPMETLTKTAMDAAIAKAIATATHARDEQHRQAREAERFVRPMVGELAIAFDSAEEIYKAALQARGFKTDQIQPGPGGLAYRAVLEQMPTTREQPRAEYLGMDSKSADDFNSRYPGASKIGVA